MGQSLLGYRKQKLKFKVQIDLYGVVAMSSSLLLMMESKRPWGQNEHNGPMMRADVPSIYSR